VRVSIVGTGRAGSAMALFLDSLGIDLHYLVDLEIERAESIAERLKNVKVAGPDALEYLDGAVILAVPDSAIREVFLELWHKNRAPEFYIHLSGMLDSVLFKEAENAGKAVASVHPNIAFGDSTESSSQLLHTIFAIEGNEKAIGLLQEFLDRHSLKFMIISKDDKILYHAAAVVSANFPVALAGLSFEVYRTIGIDERIAHSLVLSYLKDAAKLVYNGLPRDVITGPAIRGDKETVDTEARALELLDSRLAEIYEKLSGIIDSWR